MKSKTIYDFVLWAIPRFHRVSAEQKQQPPIGYFLNARLPAVPGNPAPANAARPAALPAEGSERATLPYVRH
jgi:hypothetical protein